MLKASTSNMLRQGCIQDFCQGGANLEYVKKRGGEAVRSCRAAAGGWVQEGDVPPPAQNFYLSERLRSIYMSCDML